MKTTIKILLYIPFVMMLFFTVEKLNNGEILWAIIASIATFTFGNMCGFFPLMSKFENWIKR